MSRQAPGLNRPASSLREHMSGFGYRQLDTPVIGAANLFLTRAGDRIINRLFTFSRGGQELALRPEFTSLAANYYVRGSYEGVQRWQFAGPVFEDDPVDSDGEFQRFSAGAELFGLNGAAADAEIMGMALTGLQRLGISNWRLVVGHIGLMRLILARFQLDERTERFLINNLRTLRELGVAHVLHLFERQLASTGKLPSSSSVTEDAQQLNEGNADALLAPLLDPAQHGAAMGGRSRRDIARRLLRKRQRLSERAQVVSALETLERWSQLSQPATIAFQALANLTPNEVLPVLQQWQQSVELLACYGLPMEQIVIQPDLARNWDYYSGLVFELHTADGQHLGGGGRYDELLVFLGAESSVPAVGYACWLERVVAALPGNEQPAAARPYTILLDDTNPFTATRLAQLLRKNGLAAELVNQAEADTLYIDREGSITLRQRSFLYDDEPRLLLEALRNG